MARSIPRRRSHGLAALLCTAPLVAPVAATDLAQFGAGVPSIELPALNATEQRWAADPASIPGPLRLGFGRLVPVDDAVAAFAPARWHRTLNDGHVAAVRLRSPGALGLRIGLTAAALPSAALLGFFNAKGAIVAAFAGVELNTAGGQFWSPLVRGDAAVVAVGLPPGTKPALVRLSLWQVSHLVRWLVDHADTAASADSACRLDVACYPDWEPTSRATALLVYTDQTGGTGTCTGTLLRDTDPTTEVPYVITAQHCVPNQDRAASVEAVWFHRDSRCGSRIGLPVQSVGGGAELLYSDPLADVSLLRLRRAPPAGAVFADWSLHLPEPGGAVASVHHPRGLRQAIAFGSVTSMVPCAEVPLCEGGGADDAGHYLRVRWEQGRTDVGSSGSGLFLPSGELVGVLSGGFGDCAGTPGPDHYGRFDLAYRAGLSRWLGRAMTR